MARAGNVLVKPHRAEFDQMEASELLADLLTACPPMAAEEVAAAVAAASRERSS
jgi:hypothetical protein